MVSTALLVIADENDRKQAAARLIDQGLRIATAPDCAGAVAALGDNGGILLTVADFAMEKQSGFSICRAAHSLSHPSPVILTGCRSGADELASFQNQADDCLRDPFDAALLMMRVRRLVGPAGASERGDVVLDGLRVSRREHLAEIDGQPVALTQKEFDLLYYFLLNRNLALTRDQILFYVWDTDYEGGERIVDSFVKSLRDKLGPYRKNLVTIRNVGYKFVWKAK